MTAKLQLPLVPSVNIPVLHLLSIFCSVGQSDCCKVPTFECESPPKNRNVELSMSHERWLRRFLQISVFSRVSG